jgi:GNAT superfamily N-acetyltransferase
MWPSPPEPRQLPALPFRTRTVRFDELAEVLRLIRRAIEHGCRDHYDSLQRDAVYLSYASTLFGEALAPHVTIAVDGAGGEIVAVAQLDPSAARLRALFVEGDRQQRGLGSALLADVEARALAHGCVSLNGAMSLNAVPFYARAGFRRFAGPERLTTAGVHVPVVRMRKDLRR